jgi:hypothetical protein
MFSLLCRSPSTHLDRQRLASNLLDELGNLQNEVDGRLVCAVGELGVARQLHDGDGCGVRVYCARPVGFLAENLVALARSLPVGELHVVAAKLPQTHVLQLDVLEVQLECPLQTVDGKLRLALVCKQTSLEVEEEDTCRVSDRHTEHSTHH